jgi:hypothetical protein
MLVPISSSLHAVGHSRASRDCVILGQAGCLSNHGCNANVTCLKSIWYYETRNPKAAPSQFSRVAMIAITMKMTAL